MCSAEALTYICYWQNIWILIEFWLISTVAASEVWLLDKDILSVFTLIFQCDYPASLQGIVQKSCPKSSAGTATTLT